MCRSKHNAKAHSRKPEAFLDLVEQVSPGPYLELFARRNRLGWDTWGNEAMEHVDLTTPSPAAVLGSSKWARKAS